jgi:hypothetical protein
MLKELIPPMEFWTTHFLRASRSKARGAYQWLVRAHVVRHGWRNYWTSEEEVVRRLEWAAKHYMSRWRDFIRDTSKPEPFWEKRDYWIQHWSRISCSIFNTGRPKGACRTVHRHIGRHSGRGSFGSASSGNSMAAIAPPTNSTLRVLLERLNWPVRLVRLVAAREYAALLSSSTCGERAAAAYLRWLAARKNGKRGCNRACCAPRHS